MKTHTVLIRAFCLCTMLLSARMASAQSLSTAAAGGAAHTISYQGSLTGPDGQRVPDGKATIQIELWTNASEGTRVWHDSFETDVRNGIFNLQLGSQTPLPTSTEMDKPLWLGVAINGSPEVRSPLSAVPMALNVADSSITSAKLATDYVAEISVNGERLTGRGTALNIETGDGLDATFDQSSNRLILRAGSTGPQTGKGAKAQNMNGYLNFYPWGEQGNAAGAGGLWWNIAGTTAISPFIGTTDGTPFVVKTNSTTIMQYVSTSGVPNIIGGDGTNSIGVAVQGSIIAGGGSATFPNTMAQGSDFSVIGGGDSNRAQAAYNVVGGGKYNVAGDAQYTNDTFAVVSGGIHNWAREEFSSVGGGRWNWVQSPSGAIGGGDSNTIGNEDVRSASASTIAGGYHNIALNKYDAIGGGEFDSVTADQSVVAGGESNSVRDSAHHSFVGSGLRNVVDTLAPYSNIVGGEGNLNQGNHASIVGGESNSILYTNPSRRSGVNCFIGAGTHNIIEGNGFNPAIDWALNTGIVAGSNNKAHEGNNLIGAGISNEVMDEESFIGAGDNNLILGSEDAIASGEHNTDSGSHSFLGAGSTNAISGFGNAVVAGELNYIGDIDGFVGAGYYNRIITADKSSIVGGQDNEISKIGVHHAEYGFVGGGYRNEIHAKNGTIGGGNTNVIDVGSDYGGIAGGWYNRIDSLSPYSFVGGGHINVIQSTYSAIVGGMANSIVPGSDTSFIGGGNENTISSTQSTIGGGEGNSVNAYSDHSFIGGGENNQADAMFATIGGGGGTYPSGGGGGLSPIILSPSSVTFPLIGNQDWAPYTTIGGGGTNIAADTLSSVLGGMRNKAGGFASSIGGGNGNSTDARQATIAGGYANTAYGDNSSVGGGYINYIDVPGVSANIPGGDHLIAQSYAQTVIGHYNAALGTSTDTAHIVGHDPLFIIGNGHNVGGVTARSNAFTVSDSGWATSYEPIGSGGATLGGGTNPTRLGTTYADNTIEAWGNVAGMGMNAIADAGVLSVAWQGPFTGQYLITLNTKNQDGSTHTFTANNCAIVASVAQGLSGVPGMISVMPINASGQFYVTVFGAGGTPNDHIGFMFHVITR